MAKLRLEAILGFRFLPPLPMIDPVIATIEAKRILPPKALIDLAHLAFAAAHGVPLVVTWNFRHLANAELTATYRDIFFSRGFEPPIICTPEELMGEVQ